MRNRSSFRRLVSLLAGVATLLGPIGVSLLHADDPSVEARVERSHEPGSCQVVHNHLVCAQFHNSAPHPRSDVALRRSRLETPGEALDPPTPPRRLPPTGDSLPRAPPLPA